MNNPGPIVTPSPAAGQEFWTVLAILKEGHRREITPVDSLEDAIQFAREWNIEFPRSIHYPARVVIAEIVEEGAQS